jgi:hypothetical protein
MSPSGNSAPRLCVSHLLARTLILRPSPLPDPRTDAIMLRIITSRLASALGYCSLCRSLARKAVNSDQYFDARSLILATHKVLA